MPDTQSKVRELARGQVWTFRSAPSTTARVVIGALEPFGGSQVVHVAVIGLPAPRALEKEFTQVAIWHLPFERDALERSLLEQIGFQDPPAEFEERCQTWSEALQAGEAGAMSVPVGEAVAGLYLDEGDDE